jgi:hypothetical protein
MKWAAEALVIALGVFLGITAESLWQEQNDRRQEIQHLVALREDFNESLKLLDEVEESQKLQVQYLQLLLKGNAETADPIKVRDWIRVGLYEIGRYEPQLSALQDLESSGQVQLIRDAAIRRGLAKLQQQIGLFRRRETDFIETQQRLIDPYLVSNFDLTAILDIGELSIVGKESPAVIDSSKLETAELRSAIAFKLSIRSLLRDDQAEIRTQIERVLALIQKQLEPD